MSRRSSQSVARRLATKPRRTVAPYIHDVYVADMPVGTARVVARVDTRDGTVWRTSGAAVNVSMREIRADVERGQL